MTTTLTATFDGKVLIPSGKLDLPRDTPLRLRVESPVDAPLPLRDRAAALQRRFTSRAYEGSEVLDQRRESDR
jgi:hypothetical protein